MTVFKYIVSSMFAALVFVFTAIVLQSPVAPFPVALQRIENNVCVILDEGAVWSFNKTHSELPASYSQLHNADGDLDVGQILTSMVELYAQSQEATNMRRHATMTRIVRCLIETLRSTAETVVAIDKGVAPDLAMTR